MKPIITHSLYAFLMLQSVIWINSTFASEKALNQKIKSVNNVPYIGVNQIDEFFGGTATNDKNIPSKIQNKQLYSKSIILNKCQEDEIQFEKMDFYIVKALEELFQGKTGKKLNQISKAKFENFNFKMIKNNTIENTNFDIYSIVGSNNSTVTKNQYNKYFNQFSKLEHLSIEPYRIVSHKKQRNKKNLQMKKANILAWMDVRGIYNGKRRHDRISLSLLVEKNKNTWKALLVKVLSGKGLVANKNPVFKNITASSGFNKVPIYKRAEAIRRGGYAISIGDYNKDKNLDVYIGAFKNSIVFKGAINSKFKPVSIPGLDDFDLVKSAVWADFNNDGVEDLFLVRFVPGFLDPKEFETYSDLVLYQGLPTGGFKRIASPILRKHISSNAMPSAVADFNGDGLQDIYVGFPGSLDFTFIGDAENVYQSFSKQGLFLNAQNMKFKESAKKNLPEASMNSQSQGTFPHSSLAVDYDEDGDMDLIVLDDRGNLSPIYKNNGKAEFSQVTDYTGIINRNFAMGAASGDFDNDGILDFVISNVNFLASRRMVESCNSNWHTNMDAIGVEGVKLYKGVGKGQFIDVTKTSGLGWAGEGVAGVEFYDYNNDGLLDIYVANGLWTGTKGAGDLSSVFIRDHLKNNLAVVDVLLPSETRSEYMKILTGFKGKFDGEKVLKSKSGRLSLAGFQRNRLFKNMGNGKFEDVAYLEGIDSLADGYIMALGDINHDGKMDIFLRNGDPGVDEVSYPSVEVFLNDPKQTNLNKSLLVDVREAKGKDYSTGVFVIAKIGNKKIKRHLTSNNGTSQSEKVLHFGLGDSEKVDELIVIWPNKKRKILHNLKAGRIEIYKNGDENQFFFKDKLVRK